MEDGEERLGVLLLVGGAHALLDLEVQLVNGLWSQCVCVRVVVFVVECGKST